MNILKACIPVHPPLYTGLMLLSIAKLVSNESPIGIEYCKAKIEVCGYFILKVCMPVLPVTSQGVNMSLVAYTIKTE